MKIILASASAIRTVILSKAGVPHTTIRPAIDEGKLKSSYAGLAPKALSLALAREKALSITTESVNVLVIGADQVLVCDGQLLNKPVDIEDARTQLKSLRGKTHQLISSLSICQDNRQTWSASGTAELTMRNFSDAFLADYLAKAGSDVTTTVGAYKVEDLGIQLFDRIEGDHATILGLPLLPLLDFLRRAGAIAQ